MKNNTVRIGTRGSALALYQANYVKDIINSHFPQLEVKIVIIKTKGDKILDVALSKIGDKGLFTKELELALIKDEIDLAVHSLKDMPTKLPDGLSLGAVTSRGEVADALVSVKGLKLKDLTKAHKVATSSLRRRANLLHHNPHLQIVDIRGNVNSRLKKMEDGYCDAMIMAATGLQRLGLEQYITEILPSNTFLPAVSQGIMGVEVKDDNASISEILAKINDEKAWQQATCERAFLRTLEGGCQVPVGCLSLFVEGKLKLKGFVASVDGLQYLLEEQSDEVSNAEKLGVAVADKLISAGADKILKQIKSES